MRIPNTTKKRATFPRIPPWSRLVPTCLVVGGVPVLAAEGALGSRWRRRMES